MQSNSPENSRFSYFFKTLDKAILTVIKFILGLVFIFSGFVKLIDPLGFTYKIDDYLTNFGGLWLNIKYISFYIAIALSLFEFILGLCFLFHIKLRTTSILALVFMAVMTPLTLYIAIYNPVTDCGCFGDALIISNWQTFFKNIFITGLIVVVLILPISKIKVFLSNIENNYILMFFGLGLALSIYCYNHLPIIDFLPYKKGVSIPQAMIVPEGMPKDVYETNFIYEKDGVKKEFTLENYPKGDSSWVFVDQKTNLISKGYQAPIHDFSIVNAQYDDITQDVIYYEGYSYLLIMYDLNKASAEGAKRAEKIYQKYKDSATKFYALTASSDDEIALFKQTNGLSFPFCKTDPITLKTIIRANPGLILIKNGIITGKWHWKDFE